jgi:hypothetical protein
MMRGWLPTMIAAIAVLLSACSSGKVGSDDIFYLESPLDAKKLAYRISFDSAVIDQRDVASPQTGDPGVEVTVSEEGTTGTFTVYKAPSEAHLKGMVRGIDNLLASMDALSKKKVSWCYVTRKDFLFDCQKMPPDLQKIFRERFLKALEKP